MAERRATGQPVLATRGLSRNFGGLAAVRNVSIALHQGELHAVIGPNGAGKTTLVNMLSGDIRPTAGEIALNGRQVGGEPAHRLARLGIGRSFQRTNIFTSLSVLENARLAAQGVGAARSGPDGKTWAEADFVTQARAALARVGLAEGAARTAGALSHGEQRQLEIAMKLASHPKVLAQEHAILLIEHDMDFVFAVADWMTVMAEGTVIAEGKPETIRANTAVQDAYLGGHA